MKKKIFKSLTLLLLIFALLIFSCEDINGGNGNGNNLLEVECAGCGNEICVCIIISPYKGVDWSWNQYKAALHAHSTNSDGSVILSGVIDAHYSQGIDILAITDHSDYEFHLMSNWVESRNGITQERYEEIRDGVGRDGRGMLMIPYTSEQRAGANGEEVNAFFHPSSIWQTGINFNGIGGWATTFNRVMTRIQNENGIAFINHPGRSTGAMSTTVLGLVNANNPAFVNEYAQRFFNFPNCVGMEIVNRVTDEDSLNDRIFWDNVLKVTIPHGRYVWGFSNDDSHSNSNIGLNYNMFVMPANTLENFRSTMMNGNFYAVAKVAHNEGVVRNNAAPMPAITNIVVNQDDKTITITASNISKVVWISDGVEFYTDTTTTSSSLALDDFEEDIGIFVRANLIGPGGIAFTQPFGIIKSSDE